MLSISSIRILATIALSGWLPALVAIAVLLSGNRSQAQDKTVSAAVASVLELAGTSSDDAEHGSAAESQTQNRSLQHALAIAHASTIQTKPKTPPQTAPAKKPPVSPKTKPGKEPPAKDEVAEFADAPDNVCSRCLGTGHIPLAAGTKPYLRVEGDAATVAADAVPWRFCPKCQEARDAFELVEAEMLRLRTAEESHAAWEKRTGLKLIRGESRHLTLHAETNADSLREQLKAADALVAMLQSRTKSVFLTPTRPSNFEMLTVFDRAKYMKLIEICRPLEEFKAIPDWGLLPHVTGFSGFVTTINFVPPGNPAPPANIVVSAMAVREMGVVTEGKANAWLRCGFAYFCEFAITNKIQVQYVDYKPDEVRLGPDWISETKRHAAAGNLRVWDDLFYLALNEFTAVDHLTSFASVSYLFNTDPQKFCVFCLALKRGEKAEAALPRIDGESFEKLQQNCVRAVLSSR